MVNPISYQPQQAFSGGADFSQLANLGTVYQKAQERARQQAALGSLGQGADADARALLTSGDPGLAQLGLNMQQSALNRTREDQRYTVTDARANEQLAIQRAAAQRAQETYDKSAEDEAAAAKLIGRFGTPGAAPGAAPFPAPLPGANPQPAPPSQPTAPVAGATPDAAPSAFGANPPVPSTLQAPPVKAEGGDESGLPDWANPATARITSNLASGQPAANAGISRDQLAELYRNPLTRPIATAFLQKQFDPGSWSYHKLDDGRLVATNTRTNEVKDVTPAAAPGAATDKISRENTAREQWALKSGYDPDTARSYGATGRMPKEDLSPTQEKRVNSLTDEGQAVQRVLSNVAEMRELSKSGWGFKGAGPASLAAATVLPSGLAKASGAVDTQDLINAAQSNIISIAKSTFPQRITNADLKILSDLESSANQPDAVRQRIYDRLEKVLKAKSDDIATEVQGIRTRTWNRPGANPSGLTNPAPALQWKIIP